MPAVSTPAPASPPALPAVPDRHPIWIGYDPAGGPDVAVEGVFERTESGLRFLGFAPIGVVILAKEALK